jgi:uncharacterized protein Yka (UPF0111/DUF47 family)
MSETILSRPERFSKFQALLKEVKDEVLTPAAALTQLYNGMTSVVSAAEGEIQRLREMADTASAELARLRAAEVEV